MSRNKSQSTPLGLSSVNFDFNAPAPAGDVPTCKARSYIIPDLLYLCDSQAHPSPQHYCRTIFVKFPGALPTKLNLLLSPSSNLKTQSHAHRPSCALHHPRFCPRIAVAASMTRRRGRPWSLSSPNSTPPGMLKPGCQRAWRSALRWTTGDRHSTFI